MPVEPILQPGCGAGFAMVFALLIAAMAMIGAADVSGLPVWTIHVLSSGAAATMAANGSAVQMGTIRDLLMARAQRLPCANLLRAASILILSQVLRVAG